MCVAGIAATAQVEGEPGTVDPSFRCNVLRSGIGQTIHLRADGAILVKGDFRFVNGIPRNNIARLLPDGSLDVAFDVPLRFGVQLPKPFMQADGKILLGGEIESPALGLAIIRVKEDGSLDNTFAPAVFDAGFITGFVPQLSGKVWVFGTFGSVNGKASPGLTCLNSDGTVDSQFQSPFVTVPSSISATPLLGGGAFVFGSFQLANTSTSRSAARLNAAGEVDPAFNPTVPATIGAATLLPDGKLLLGFRGSGIFAHVMRLNSDGTTDATFTPPADLLAGWNISRLTVLANGDVIVADQPSNTLPLPAFSPLVRLNSDGSIDDTFRTPGFDSSRAAPFVSEFVVRENGSIVAVGRFESVDSVDAYGIVQLTTDGHVDSSFHPGITTIGGIGMLAVQPDDKVVVGGSILFINDIKCTNLARLNPNGTVDLTFRCPLKVTPSAMALQSDGRLLLGGTLPAEARRNIFVRLLADGSIDPSFQPDPQVNGSVTAIATQSGGRILVAGSFSDLNAANQTLGLLRLFADGTRDTNFIYRTTSVKAIGVDSNDKVWISANNLDRLNENGSADWQVFAFAPDAFSFQTDGKIIASFRGVRSDGSLQRLNSNGTRDLGFEVGTNLAGGVFSYLIQRDQRIVFAHRTGVRRLNPDGSRNTSFFEVPVTTRSGSGIAVIRSQSDGRILVAGDISLTSNSSMNLIRLYGELTPRLAISQSTDGQIVLSWPVAAQGFALEVKGVAPETEWSVVETAPTVTGSSNTLSVLRSPSGAVYRLRATR
jgi:uncharacterized delta-60 repeat protein